MSRCLICFILLLVLFAGCSGQDESILTKPVQKDPGALEILNPTSFMGATVSGNIIDHVLTIKASGGLALRNINVSITTSDPISFKGGTYPGTGGTCDETLSSGETCTIIIRYEPTNTNSHMANLKFTYQDALKSYEKIYQVSADSFPILTFGYGTIYDFSNKFVGTTTDLRIRIENSGRARADNISINNLSPPFSIKGGTYPGQGGTCGNNLLPGQTCDIFVTYAPTNNGQHLQDVILTYTNTGRTESNTLRMMAWGFYQAQLTVSDSSGYDFGTVANGKTLDKTFTITYSSGDVNATSINLINLNSPFSFKGGTFPGTGGDCTTILSKERGSCRVVVSLLSQQSGTWNNNIGFKYFNGTDEITVNRSLTASTRQKAEIAFSPLGTTPFGTLELESSQSKLFTVTYTGGEMTATNLGFSGLSGFYNYTGGTYPGTGGSCGANLIAGSCTISLTYRPTSNGNHLLNPSFVYHDGADAKSIPITLAGTTPSRLSYGPTSFGNIVTEQVATLALTITSSGGTGISGLTFSTIGSPFSVTSSTCTSSLAANANCRLNLAFNPLTSGPHETNLQVTYHTGTRVVTDELTLSGNATPAAPRA